MTQGVEQASILGPVIFLVYANIFSDGMAAGLLYMDYACLSDGRTVAEQAIQRWCDSVGLMMICDKTGLISIQKIISCQSLRMLNCRGCYHGYIP